MVFPLYELIDKIERAKILLEIDILEPDEVDRAKQILLRDGFVAVRNVLVGAQLERIQKAADALSKKLSIKIPNGLVTVATIAIRLATKFIILNGASWLICRPF